MDKADIAALLALGAAFFIAVGDVIHQRSAHEVTDEPVSHLRAVRRLLRDRQWWTGQRSGRVGFALQAAALGLGSVLLVQALLVTSLLFALPMNARLSHRRVTRWEWLWAALLAAAVAVIVTVGNPTEGAVPRVAGDVDGGDRWSSGPLLVLCVVGAPVWSGPVSAVLLAVVSGSAVGRVRRADQGRRATASTHRSRRRAGGTPRALRVGGGRDRWAPRGSSRRSAPAR